MVPDDFKNFYLGRNSLFFPEFEFVIKLSFPRVFVRYKVTEGYYTNFDKFFNNIENEHNQILNDVWNYITMEKNPLRNDYLTA